jgi:hypothetical protein
MRRVREVRSQGGRLRRSATRLLLFLALLVGVATFAAGPGSAAQSASSGLKRAQQAQEQHSDRLLAKRAVVGTATGRTDGGVPSVEVYTVKRRVRGIPRKLDGVPVDVDVTGKLFAVHHRQGHGGPGGGTLSPTDRWPRPVPIGISTGNEGECSAGTIGARLTRGGQVYALSNNHVYALENDASIGSIVLQPGRFDTGCQLNPNDVLGQLSDYEPLRFNGQDNFIDAAIALTSVSSLGNATPPDGYGAPRSAAVAAQVGQAVQKYGRTSALTTGTVTGINAILEVGYESGIAEFVDQVIVQGRKPFLKSGDSGSLAVTSPGRNPVALLFAADNSGKFAVANRIDRVLSRFGATVDGD